MSSKAASQVAAGTAGRSASVDRKTRNGPGHAQPETTAFKECDEEVTDGKNRKATQQASTVTLSLSYYHRA